MQVEAIQTDRIVPGDDLYHILDQALQTIPEKSVVAITSKIISLCENHVVDPATIDKTTLIKREADAYVAKENQYGYFITIKNNILIPFAGIDESNANGLFVLWPKNPQESANVIRDYLRKKHSVKDLGVIITDSTITPLRWGVTGRAIAHSGFRALHDKRGHKDLFGKDLEVTQVSVSDALAAAAVFEMGEAAEQTPLALITNLPQVEFQDHPPTQEELDKLFISREEDFYAPLLQSVTWKTGRSE